MSKKRLSSQSRRSEKNNQSIIPKPHAHLHSMLKTSAVFQNNWWKTVRGVVPTRYPLSLHFDSISYWKKTKFTKQKKWEKTYSKDYIQTTCTSSFHAENIWLCRESSDLAEIRTPRFDACPRYLQLWKDLIKKQQRKGGDIVFPIISQWAISVAMETRVLIQSVPKPYAALNLPPP